MNSIPNEIFSLVKAHNLENTHLFPIAGRTSPVPNHPCSTDNVES